jgi:6-phosphogluconolactonase/glucosamine-6-phosphate isomerase/deaminase
VRHEIIEAPSAEAAAVIAASLLASLAADAIARDGHAAIAVSGGRTPGRMFDALVDAEHDLSGWRVWQVDERVAPDGDPARNVTALERSLEPRGADILAMPVTASDLADATIAYGENLPDYFDVVHLGLGSDGHTASLIPDDPVLDSDELVALTEPYQGHRRLTLTYRSLTRARTLLWLVTGADKAEALTRLLADDPSIPAGRMAHPHNIIVADAAARGAVAPQQESERS